MRSEDAGGSVESYVYPLVAATGERWPSTTTNSSRTPLRGKLGGGVGGHSSLMGALSSERMCGGGGRLSVGSEEEGLKAVKERVEGVLRGYERKMFGLKERVGFLEKENKMLRRKLEQRALSSGGASSKG